MDSEYDVQPINQGCSNITYKTTVISNPGSTTSDVKNDINKFHDQYLENTRYDTFSEDSVQKMYGGNIKKFIIYTNKKRELIDSHTEKEAIHKIINKLMINKQNKKNKQDYIIGVSSYHSNEKSIYHFQMNDKNNTNNTNNTEKTKKTTNKVKKLL
jgi:hypothetical protein